MSGKQEYLEQAYIRGDYVGFQDATVSVATNALQYGMAIFGGVKGYVQPNGSIGIFRLDDHIKRMENSAKILRMPFDFDEAHIKKVFVELTKKNRPTNDVYYRPFIYRSDIALSPAISGDYDFALYMLNVGDYFDKSRGLRVNISSWTRNSDNALPPRTKASGGYVNAALAMHDAKSAGYDAAILLDSSGHVGEGAVMNLFMVRDGVLITPDINADILEGITRKTIIELAQKAGIPVEARPIDRTELYLADEVFFSGTATEMTWVESVDSVVVSKAVGPVFSNLLKSFNEVTSKPNDYLTIV